MAKLHPLLADALPLLPQEHPVHLFTRHSVREEAPQGFADYRLPLTAEGVALAKAWAGQLQRPVRAFYSSPVNRCVDTAKAMAETCIPAAETSPPIETTPLLVEPGCYVEDIRLAGPVFMKKGAMGFLNRHLSTGVEGVLSPEEGQRKLIAHLRQPHVLPGELVVHVTHDTILAAFMASLMGLERLTSDDWPWMMEGAWLWFAENQLHWIWRGASGQLPLPS